MLQIAALFVDKDGAYANLPGVDAQPKVAPHMAHWMCGWVSLEPVTAQAAPAADHDHGPQSTTVEEAARHVGKWLNERPNRPLDLRDVAMLVAHAQAPAAGAVAGPGMDAILAAARKWGDVEPYLCRSGSGEQKHRIVFHVHERAAHFAKELLAAAPTQAAQADSGVQEDAARWQELREQHEDDTAERCCVFAPNDMRECLVPVGSLPGELDIFMDSERQKRAALAAKGETE